MTAHAAARDAIAAIQGHEAWAIIRRSTRAGDRDTVGVIGGRRWIADSIMDIPLEEGPPVDGRQCDRLVAVPFRQIAERGFEAHDDGTPLVVVDVDEEHEFSVPDVIAAIDDNGVDFVDRGGFESSDDDYAKVVESIIKDEIGQGEGANLVVGRHYRAVVADWGADKALAVFRRLLERERGAYWTFLFFTGDRYLVGASPERHVSVHGGDVRMNPISGTFHLRPPAGETRGIQARLGDFLRDEKEIYELFMVVDEELKMMCDICTEGGQVLGPFLKPMTHLIHTEYLLAGRTGRDVREVLRDTMFAATVTGSPVENACRLIKEYEPEGRGYYASALALFGRDESGAPVVDSPIVIRTADVDLDGNLRVTAGATLVRDSDPAYEVAETHAKAGGILSAFGLVDRAPVPDVDIANLVADEDVLIALHSRNKRLSTFWLDDQSDLPADPRLAGKSAVILDNADDFVNMLRHILSRMGMSSTVVRHEDYAPGSFDGHDLVIVGPGPGDPRDGEDAKIATVRRAVDALLESQQPFLAVCLGHQTLCERLGIPLAYKDIVFQGTQSLVELDGRPERVGFYNTFVGRADRSRDGRFATSSTSGGRDGRFANSSISGGRDGRFANSSTSGGRGGTKSRHETITVDADPETGDIHALTGPHYRGVQFHAESILTQHGYAIIHDLVRDVLFPGDASA